MSDTTRRWGPTYTLASASNTSNQGTGSDTKAAGSVQVCGSRAAWETAMNIGMTISPFPNYLSRLSSEASLRSTIPDLARFSDGLDRSFKSAGIEELKDKEDLLKQMSESRKQISKLPDGCRTLEYPISCRTGQMTLYLPETIVWTSPDKLSVRSAYRLLSGTLLTHLDLEERENLHYKLDADIFKTLEYMPTEKTPLDLVITNQDPENPKSDDLRRIIHLQY